MKSRVDGPTPDELVQRRAVRDGPHTFHPGPLCKKLQAKYQELYGLRRVKDAGDMPIRRVPSKQAPLNKTIASLKRKRASDLQELVPEIPENSDEMKELEQVAAHSAANRKTVKHTDLAGRLQKIADKKAKQLLMDANAAGSYAAQLKEHKKEDALRMQKIRNIQSRCLVAARQRDPLPVDSLVIVSDVVDNDGFREISDQVEGFRV
jgi:hypothetical protein